MNEQLLKTYITLREKGVIGRKEEYEQLIEARQEQEQHTAEYQEWKESMDPKERKVFEYVFEI
jgi:hypothetical protein